MKWYKEKVRQAAQCNTGKIELKKENIYEQGKKSRCIIILVVLSKKKLIDEYLIRSPIAKCNSLKYVQFEQSNTQEKIKAIYVNEYQKYKPNFEILYNINNDDNAEYMNNKGTLRDILLKVELQGNKLFTHIEQGIGQNSTHVYLIYHPIR